jgi:2-oxoglutarate dehydrogenase complex dehydrogenase (E1) component-like enzyme
MTASPIPAKRKTNGTKKDFYESSNAIDQYISCGEEMNNQNGIVMLPSRIEGQVLSTFSVWSCYLQLCARHNMYVADCTTQNSFSLVEDK